MSFSFQGLPKSFRRHLPERLLIFIGFLLSIAIAYWDITKRYPLIGDYQKKIQSVHIREDEIAGLKSQYTDQLLKETEPGYLNALNYVFTNEEDINLWFDYFKTRAKNVGLEMEQRPTTNNVVKTPKASIIMKSYQIELKPMALTTNALPTHERLLYFLQELSTNQFKRLDFMELKAAGDGNQLEQAIVGIQLWYLTNAP
ncbi:MAG: hypothetical protein ACP5T0_06590 [Verrucomicrobiia bacterium]